MGSVCRYLIIFLVLFSVTRASDVHVSIPLGEILGQRLPFNYSDNLISVSTTVDTFYSIPYAEPPTGEYRFRKTVPKEPWQDVWNATYKRPVCWQVGLEIAQDEDCLHLNVWTPSIENNGLPVMVFIHGGAFIIGSGVSPSYDGSALAAMNDVIVVSMNYRLNAFGFLYAGDAAKGNYGLWDQHEAIKWTYNNIEAFGGDPEQITVFGQSAGGAGTGFQLISEQSRGYFKRAILMSGSMAHPWATELDYNKAKGDAYLVGEKSGCRNMKTDQELVTCLRGKDAQRITLAVDLTFLEVFKVVLPLVPVVDGEFITNDPRILLDQGRYKHCDVMLGTTTDDGTIFAASAYFGDLNEPVPYSDYEDFREKITDYTFTYKNEMILSAIEQQYLDWANTDNATLNYFYTYKDIITDEAFYHSIDYVAQKFAKGGNNVYKYLFNHLPGNTFYNIPGLSWPWKGIAHVEDIPFVFGKPFSGLHLPNVTYSEEDKKLSLDMMRYYTNFAKSGNPNLDHNSGQCRTDGVCHWSRYDVLDKTLKSFEIPLTDKLGYRAEYSNFWNKYLPKQLLTFTADPDELQRQWEVEFERWRTDDLTEWRKEQEDYNDVADECSQV